LYFYFVIFGNTTLSLQVTKIWS